MPPGKSCEIVAAAFSVVSGPYNPIPERPHLACAMRTIIDLLASGQDLPGGVGSRVVAVDRGEHAVDDAVDDALLGVRLVDAEEVLLAEQGAPVGPPWTSGGRGSLCERGYMTRECSRAFADPTLPSAPWRR